MDRSSVSLTMVPGGRSIKKDTMLNITKNIKKTAFTNIQSAKSYDVCYFI